jgi:hypothetical protein
MLAAGYQSLERTYRQREAVFAQTISDRADWETATRAQRQLAVAADAELRRRRPGQYFSPLRSAEPEPAIGAQRAELTLTAGQPPGEIDQWINDLAAGHRTFADRQEDLHTICTRSASLLHTRELRCGVTGPGLGGAALAWFGCGKPACSW